ncbi:GerMN domain-containing protein [Geodermatophilus sp. DSM 44513]|uniref:GerMN domain-containing protein n=1 Tax=Geodermatophilus sp. DSM 44513 TaxID=1528104 RepID=UPI001286AFC3|nr:GerMN domain-containing protein [Geodermatophilus sp. DSM 44513]WNV73636.1 GerMN domain-containing protein [Geodermatophilus sp. DSM 44513]
MRRPASLLPVLLALAACGVGPQDAPEPVPIPPAPAPAPESGAAPDGPRVTVWFVRGARLEAAERVTGRADIGAALDALAGGPTRAEAVDGLRTALVPQGLAPGRPTPAEPVVTVEVTREFTEVAGDDQLLATAQVVFTVTGFPGVQAVRVTAEGAPVEVPTDDGLTAGPVDRDDYASVAADEPPPPAPTPGAPPSEPPAAPTPGSTAPSTPGRRPPRRWCHGTAKRRRLTAR